LPVGVSNGWRRKPEAKLDADRQSFGLAPHRSLESIVTLEDRLSR